MAECINCSNQAFETVGDDEVLVNGIISDELGITQDMTLREVLYKMVAKIEELSTDVPETAATEDVGVLTATSAPKVTKSENTFPLTVTPNGSNTTINYDLTDATGGKSMKAFTRVTAFGTSAGKATKVYEGATRAGSFEVSPESFPLNINFEATVVEGEGQKVYRFSKTIANESQLTDEFMDVTDLTQRDVVNQKDVNELLDSEIGKLRNRINALEKG